MVDRMWLVYPYYILHMVKLPTLHSVYGWTIHTAFSQYVDDSLPYLDEWMGRPAGGQPYPANNTAGGQPDIYPIITPTSALTLTTSENQFRLAMRII